MRQRQPGVGYGVCCDRRNGPEIARKKRGFMAFIGGWGVLLFSSGAKPLRLQVKFPPVVSCGGGFLFGPQGRFCRKELGGPGPVGRLGASGLGGSRRKPAFWRELSGPGTGKSRRRDCWGGGGSADGAGWLRLWGRRLAEPGGGGGLAIGLGAQVRKKICPEP